MRDIIDDFTCGYELELLDSGDIRKAIKYAIKSVIRGIRGRSKDR